MMQSSGSADPDGRLSSTILSCVFMVCICNVNGSRPVGCMANGQAGFLEGKLAIGQKRTTAARTVRCKLPRKNTLSFRHCITAPLLPHTPTTHNPGHPHYSTQASELSLAHTAGVPICILAWFSLSALWSARSAATAWCRRDAAGCDGRCRQPESRLSFVNT